jgi:MFS family permease
MFGKITSHFRIYDRRVLYLFGASMITAAGFAVVIPFLSLYFYVERGIPMSLVGTLLLFSAGAGASAQFVGGELCDRFGRKIVIVSSLFARSGIFFVISVCVALDAPFYLVAALVVVASILGGLFRPAINAMVADLVPAKDRVEAFGLLRISMNIGWAAGPALGGFLAAFSYSALFLLTGVAGAAAATLVHLRIAESLTHANVDRFSIKDFRQIAEDRLFLQFCLISLFLFVLVGQMMSTLSVFSTEQVGISKIQLGYMYTLNGLLVAVLQFPIALLIKKGRMTTALILGALVYAVGYFFVGLAGSYLALMICMTIVSLGEILISPSGMTLVANLSPEDRKGRYMGIYGLAMHFGWSVGPFVGGLALDAWIGNGILLWTVLGALGIVSAGGYIWLRRRTALEVDLGGEKLMELEEIRKNAMPKRL